MTDDRLFVHVTTKFRHGGPMFNENVVDVKGTDTASERVRQLCLEEGLELGGWGGPVSDAVANAKRFDRVVLRAGQEHITIIDERVE